MAALRPRERRCGARRRRLAVVAALIVAGLAIDARAQAPAAAPACVPGCSPRHVCSNGWCVIAPPSPDARWSPPLPLVHGPVGRGEFVFGPALGWWWRNAWMDDFSADRTATHGWYLGGKAGALFPVSR